MSDYEYTLFLPACSFVHFLQREPTSSTRYDPNVYNTPSQKQLQCSTQLQVSTSSIGTTVGTRRLGRVLTSPASHFCAGARSTPPAAAPRILSRLPLVPNPLLNRVVQCSTHGHELRYVHAPLWRVRMAEKVLVVGWGLLVGLCVGVRHVFPPLPLSLQLSHPGVIHQKYVYCVARRVPMGHVCSPTVW